MRRRGRQHDTTTRDNGKRNRIKIQLSSVVQLRSSRNGIYSIWERKGQGVRRERIFLSLSLSPSLGSDTMKTALGGIFRRASCRLFFAVFHLAYLRISSPMGACTSVRAHFLATHGRTWDIRIWFTPRSMLVCSLAPLRISQSSWYFLKNNINEWEWYKFQQCHGEISNECVVGRWFICWFPIFKRFTEINGSRKYP